MKYLLYILIGVSVLVLYIFEAWIITDCRPKKFGYLKFFAVVSLYLAGIAFIVYLISK